MAGKPRTPEQAREAFWSYIDIRGEDECWPWLRTPGSHGYGNFTARSIKYDQDTSHRWAFFFANGYWPNVGRHTCDYRLCCNPEHIVDGTQADNMADARERSGMLPPPPMRGSSHYNAKMTEDQVREIRSRKGNGESAISISRSMSLGYYAVKDVCLGRSWKCLT